MDRYSIRIGVPSVLGVLFVVLKLCGLLAWPWWLVTLPFWICGALLGIAVACFVTFWTLLTLINLV